eukprot:363380-Prorocentrum_minimum.AAC.1
MSIYNLGGRPFTWNESIRVWTGLQWDRTSMNYFIATSEATSSFGPNPSGSVRQPGPSFRSEHLWRCDSPSTERKPPLQAHFEGDQGYTIKEPP